MKNQNFENNSFIYGDYISEDLCDKILEFYNNNEKIRSEGKVGKDNLDETTKKSTEVVLNPKLFFKLFPEYAKNLDDILRKYLIKYTYANEAAKFNVFDNVKIQHYKPQEGFYKWHCENNGEIHTIQRHLVFMTYLNDVEDGGTEFYYQNLKVKAEKGFTIIWPSQWTHVHRGIISSTKEKAIVTGWYDYEYLSRK